MTAIGFVLLFAGWFIESMFGAEFGTNKADQTACALYFSGLIVAVAGLATWFWRWLP